MPLFSSSRSGISSVHLIILIPNILCFEKLRPCLHHFIRANLNNSPIFRNCSSIFPIKFKTPKHLTNAYILFMAPAFLRNKDRVKRTDFRKTKTNTKASLKNIGLSLSRIGFDGNEVDIKLNFKNCPSEIRTL